MLTVENLTAGSDAVWKLYPWEWIAQEQTGAMLERSGGEQARGMWEPAWKILVGNKAMLAMLWERFPGHPNLLPACLLQTTMITQFISPLSVGPPVRFELKGFVPPVYWAIYRMVDPPPVLAQVLG